MTPSSNKRSSKGRAIGSRPTTVLRLAGLALFCLVSASAAQGQTPANPAAGAPKSGQSSSALGPPTIPIDEIIQKFAAREAEFKTERDNFTYTQTFSIQTLDAGGRPDGEYKMTSDIVFTPQGKRYEKVTYAPPPTLERIQLSQQDLDDLEHVQPFVLTTAELPKYNVKYVDHVPLDELGTYIFDVGPKTIEKNQRYFQGRVWVDDKDYEIVKTDGKAVPDIRKGGQENVFPRFETFRENVEGDYWFPTYTRSNDVLHFSSGDIPIRMTVRYENYKRFGVTVKIGKPAETQKDKQ
ncbi:MAG: hypothetical protein ABSA96_05635 [Candidatus Acidiferrales bacterium]|jgi:hypothetical protein